MIRYQMVCDRNCHSPVLWLYTRGVGGVMGAWLIDGSWWGVEREPWLIDLGFTETQQQRLLHSWGRQRDADFPIANNCIKFEVCTDKDVFVQ